MKYASLVERIGGEGSRAWEIHERAREREARGEDVIVLSIGDPDFETPSAITDVAVQSLRAGRMLSLDYPEGRMVGTLEACGFEAHQTLIWMESKL